MSLNSALARFPAGSRLRPLVEALASDDPERRLEAYSQTRPLTEVKDWQDARTPNWALSEAEARALLLAVAEVELPLPPPEAKWMDGCHELLTALWRSPHPGLEPLVPPVYARLQDSRRRCALLALLGILGTREAAEGFAGCIRERGWPDRAYSRVWEELQNLFAYPDFLLPDVVTTAGSQSVDVGNAVLGALCRGLLKPQEVGDQLEGLAPYVVKSLKQALKTTTKHQEKPGLAWRFAERYGEVRHRAAMFLDLTGYLRSPKLSEPLRQAAEFRDPRLATFAALALLRRGEEVPPAALETGAASHETRAILFEGLRSLGLVARFPARWRTWEAFGAAAMIEWLLYPAELGREPDELERAHTEQIDPEQLFYVWKFRNDGEPWRAGVSGPHRVSGEPEPVHGSYTFSRFEEWEGATAQEHLERCVGTVEEFRDS